jgi:hypothetical protein
MSFIMCATLMPPSTLNEVVAPGEPAGLAVACDVGAVFMNWRLMQRSMFPY